MVGLEPNVVNFGQVKIGGKVTRTVELVGQEAEGVQLTIDEVSDDAITTRVRKEAGKTLLEVTLDPDRPRQLKGRLSVSTSHAKVPKIHLRIHGQVIGNVRVAPNSVSIQGLDAEPKPGVVILTSDKPGFQVRSATDPKGMVDVVVAEQDGTWRIEVTPKESGEGTRSFRTHLKVETNDDLEPIIEVPVLARASAHRRRPQRGPIPGVPASTKPSRTGDAKPAK